MVRLVALALAHALLALGVSGCVEPARPSACATDAPCEDMSQGAQASSTSSSVHFEACRGGIAGVQVPFERARARVPAEFLVDGVTPATASLVLQFLTCDRIVANATVFEGASWLKGAVFVHPSNASWRAPGTHYYVLGVWSSAPDLANAFHSVGLDAEPATFDTVLLPSSSGPALELWSVEASDCAISVSFRRTGQGGLESRGEFHHWVGAAPFARLEAHQDYQYDSVTDAAPVLLEGACVLADVAGPAAPHVSQAYERLESSWSIDGRRYS